MGNLRFYVALEGSNRIFGKCFLPYDFNVPAKFQIVICCYNVPESSNWQPNASTAMLEGLRLLAAVHPDYERCARDFRRELKRLKENDVKVQPKIDRAIADANECFHRLQLEVLDEWREDARKEEEQEQELQREEEELQRKLDDGLDLLAAEDLTKMTFD